MPRHSPYALLRLNFPIGIISYPLVLFVLLNCLSFLNFLGYSLSAVEKTFLFLLWLFFHLSVKLFLPYFYRKTYTNLLIFVLFFCSFLTLQSFLYSVFNDQTHTLKAYEVKNISRSHDLATCVNNILPLFVFSLLDLTEWLAQVDSNHRPRAYQARALTTWAMRHRGYTVYLVFSRLVFLFP